MQLADNTRNAALDAMVDLIDLGSTNANGRMFIYTSGGGTTLATIELNIPSFNAAAAGSVSMIVVPDVEDAAADATGVAAEMTIVDRDENVIFSGSVGTSGKDLNLNSVNLEAGVPVKITNCVLTQPAGSPAA